MNFLTKKIFQIFCFLIFAHFLSLLDEPFRNEGMFISFLSKVQVLVLGVKKAYLQFLLIFYPFDPHIVDSHIIVDPDPGSLNLADPTVVV